MVENCKTLRKAGWSKIREGENASLNVKMSIFAIMFKMFSCFLLLLIVFFIFTLVKIDKIALIKNDYTVILMVINYVLLSMLLIALVPLDVGISNIFLKISRGQQVKYTDIFVGYKHFFKIFGLELLRGLYIFLWSLLLFVPGIIKSLSLSQVHTVFLDNQEMKITDILNESQRLMYGKKMFYFCLALSFIGWGLLSVLTFGLLDLVIIPVVNIANSAFYNNLIDYNAPGELEENTEDKLEQKAKRVMNKTLIILSVVVAIAIGLSLVVCSVARFELVYVRDVRQNIFHYLLMNNFTNYKGDIILILLFSFGIVVLNILSVLLNKNTLHIIKIILSIFAIVFVWYFYCKLFIKPTGKFGEVFFGMFNFVNNKALQYAADFLPVFVFFNAVNIGVSFFQIDCANAIRGKVA